MLMTVILIHGRNRFYPLDNIYCLTSPSVQKKFSTYVPFVSLQLQWWHLCRRRELVPLWMCAGIRGTRLSHQWVMWEKGREGEVGGWKRRRRGQRWKAEAEERSKLIVWGRQIRKLLRKLGLHLCPPELRAQLGQTDQFTLSWSQRERCQEKTFHEHRGENLGTKWSNPTQRIFKDKLWRDTVKIQRKPPTLKVRTDRLDRGRLSLL